jgi:two-component system, NarL family, response regulator DevR
VMALRPPDTAVIEASRRIRSSDPVVKVLLLVSYRHDAALLSTLLAGAAGFVPMDLDSRALLQAVRALGAGGALLDRQRMRRVLDDARTVATSRASRYPRDFSALEDLLLDMIGDGDSDPEIARRLSLTPDTIREHSLRLYTRLLDVEALRTSRVTVI